MLHICIYGDQKYSFTMKCLLEGPYSDLLQEDSGERLSVDSFVLEESGQSAEGIPVIALSQFAESYHKGEVQAIVIPKEYFKMANAAVIALIRSGVKFEDIYNGARLQTRMEHSRECMANLITPYLEDPYLAYLEYHVADHCNLNCKYCTHFSPLVEGEVQMDSERFRQDIQQMKRLVKDIGVIRILGGEPLLNPRLPDFIGITRKAYPKAIIYVVTNGVLIEKIGDELVSAMKENTVFFHISYYPVLETRITGIQKFLSEKGILYMLSTPVKYFERTQCLEENPDSEFFYKCFQSGCTCLYEGKLATCMVPFATKYFNRAFRLNLPENEGIDLYDGRLDLETLKKSLLTPMERCKYCTSGELHPWQALGRNSSLEDWV